jgi:thymidylate kinase
MAGTSSREGVLASPWFESLHQEDRSLLAGTSERDLTELGLPAAEVARNRSLAYEAVAAMLDGAVEHNARVSPLGPAWSSDIDITAEPNVSRLEKAGWINLDGLLNRLGSRGSGRWLVMIDGLPVGMADYDPAPNRMEPVARIVGRAVERGRVELRDVLELRHARREGLALPRHEVITAASSIEAGLGGHDLAQYLDGASSLTPVSLRSGSWRRTLASQRRLLRPRPIIALSGVDGAGKSSLTKSLQTYFSHIGLEADAVWARPGMRLDFLDPLIQRLKRSNDVPTVALVAAGESTNALSRRGFVGWSWTMLVTTVYLVDVWTRQLRRSGLKVYDRHVLDAIVTLDFVYDGVDLRVPKLLIRGLLPRSSITLYLDIDAASAAARKPGDTFGRHAVEQQLDRYSDLLTDRPDIVRVDATDDPGRLATKAFVEITRRLQ